VPEGPPRAERSAQRAERATAVPIAFARRLRRHGVAVPMDGVLAYCRALSATGFERADWVYWAGRATLVRQPELVPRYDRAFVEFWGDPVPDIGPPAAPRPVPVGAGPEAGRARPIARYSAREALRHKDFARCSAAELEEAAALVAQLRLSPAHRPSRRWRRSSARRGRLDTARTLRRSVREGGEVVHRHFRRPGERARRVVLLCDVSGSMEAYTRFFLRFLHLTVLGLRHAEVFGLGTRLTRLTRSLSRPDADEALAAAAEALPDRSGGTRLGETLHEFNTRYGIPGMARGAIVVVLSDGLDRGRPDLLAAEMARLHRVAWRVVWVNPLKGSDGYAPLARGMAAALPFVDVFEEGHSVASLEALSSVLATQVR
jgi:uncharacterized protein with von Willebrand factor type A (vWA) domain